MTVAKAQPHLHPLQLNYFSAREPSVPGSHHHTGPQMGAEHQFLHQKESTVNVLPVGVEEVQPVKVIDVNFYSISKSILSTCITVWYTATTAKDKGRLQRIIRPAGKVICCHLCRTCTPPGLWTYRKDCSWPHLARTSSVLTAPL